MSTLYLLYCVVNMTVILVGSICRVAPRDTTFARKLYHLTSGQPVMQVFLCGGRNDIPGSQVTYK